ncbi:odorant receptor 67c-like [Leptopilina boulardi]|uniref:odorant receptor 67c-like n=1 Tax=Leptopilina boulardi TaxID=63433 RepID=UPI0021F5B9C9|nr:odorant receptor 67c-like [Leptopilina boulardi]
MAQVGSGNVDNDQKNFIFRMEKQLNKLFGFLIFMQFFISILNLCTSCFYITKLQYDNTFFLSTICMSISFLFQIFLYCWFGESMSRRSLAVADIIYQMDWNVLSKQTKQTLLIIMMRASHPIKLTGSSLIIVSIETFLKILKVSYSAFNLIRNVS